VVVEVLRGERDPVVRGLVDQPGGQGGAVAAAPLRANSRPYTKTSSEAGERKEGSRYFALSALSALCSRTSASTSKSPARHWS
jgi:hypothetical protein